MLRKLIISLFLVLLSSATVVAEDNGSNQPAESQESSAPTVQKGSDVPGGESDAKMIRGMAVLGNNEAPMSLFIVPWESSELGIETNLSRTLNERDVPIDREVFRRELDFYQVSVEGKEAAPAAVSKMLKAH